MHAGRLVGRICKLGAPRGGAGILALGLLLATSACSGASRATSVPPSTAAPPTSASPSATASSAAAASASASSAANSAGVKVGDFIAFKDSYGRVRVAGYLINGGQQPVDHIQAMVQLRDSAGRTLGQEHSTYTRNIVPPGQRTPFLTIFLAPPPDWVKATVQAQAQPAQLTPQEQGILQTVQTENVTGTGNGQGFTISGQVKNGWSKAVSNVSVLGILYDNAGKPLDVRESDTAFEQLQPGSTLNFGFEFYNSNQRPADQLKWDLYVDASPAAGASGTPSGSPAPSAS